MDPHINPVTKVWDDNYYANNHLDPNASGYSGGNGGMADSTIAAQIAKIQADAQNAYNTKYNEYAQNNPFNFDQVLAKKTEQARGTLDPYYNQVLGDFMTGINYKKSRSLEDERNLLTEITGNINRYTGQQQAALADTLEKTGQGYAINGMYDSGKRLRDQGQQTVITGENIQNYVIPQQYQARQAQISTNRLVNQDLPLAVQIEKRNLGAEEAYNAKAQGLNAANTAQSQYTYAQQQYAGAQPGVTPIDQNLENNKILTGA
jgi:hypothetical protein